LLFFSTFLVSAFLLTAWATYGQLALEHLRDPTQSRYKTVSDECCKCDLSRQSRGNMAAQQKDPEVIALARKFNHTPTDCDEYEKMVSGML